MLPFAPLFSSDNSTMSHKTYKEKTRANAYYYSSTAFKDTSLFIWDAVIPVQTQN